MKGVRVLVVDDEPGIRRSLGGVLEDEGFAVASAESGEACLDELSRSSYDLVILDVWLPGIDGLETLMRIQEMPLAGRPAVVMISGHGNIETAVKATKLGAFDFLEKPLSIEKIMVVAGNAVTQRRLRNENSRLREITASKHHIVGATRSIGLFGIVELVKDRASMEPLAPFNGTSDAMKKLGRFFRDEGLYTFVRMNTFSTNPPLIITEEELRHGFDIIDRGLTALA